MNEELTKQQSEDLAQLLITAAEVHYRLHVIVNDLEFQCKDEALVQMAIRVCHTLKVRLIEALVS